MALSVWREIRISAFCLWLILLYGLVIAAIAADSGQLELLSVDAVSGLVAEIWLFSFTFAFCAYGLHLILFRRPARPVATLIDDVGSNLLRADWLISRATIILISFTLTIFFTPMKIMIGHLQGFKWDAELMQLDRILFFGVDPWRLTHAIFGTASATFFLQLVYNLWFVLMWFSLIYCVLRAELFTVRARYLISFILSWILVGSVFAWLLASAGPCFYERAFGDAHFAPLMQALQALDTQRVSTMPGLGVHALRVQNMLWNAFTAQQSLLGGGISAAPSMHVSLAVLMACAGWTLSRRLGALLWLFAALIWIGSIHLGWHYAVDGLIALPLTLMIWRLSGWLVDRLVFERGPAALPQPALAE